MEEIGLVARTPPHLTRVQNTHIIVDLTHLPLDKMEDDIFRCLFLNGKFCILIQISLKIVPKGSIDNDPALV